MASADDGNTYLNMIDEYDVGMSRRTSKQINTIRISMLNSPISLIDRFTSLDLFLYKSTESYMNFPVNASNAVMSIPAKTVSEMSVNMNDVNFLNK
jgi:hypothetical protein